MYRLLRVLRAIVTYRLSVVLILGCEVLFVRSPVAALAVVASVALVSLGMASSTMAMASLMAVTTGRGRGRRGHEAVAFDVV